MIWRGEGTILLVDDDEAIRSVVKQMLEWSGFQVIVAGNGDEAVKLFACHADDVVCVILDLSMPVMNGEEALAALRAIRPDVRVIVTSGFGLEEVIERIGAEQPNDILRKPYEWAALLLTLRTVLGEDDL